MTKVLIVLSAADNWTRADGSLYPTGVWAQEFVDIDERLVAAGYQVDLASPAGKTPTMDTKSLDPEFVGAELAATMNDYLAKNEARLKNPLVLADVSAGDYDAIIVPGGHGPVEDLYRDADAGRLLADAQDEGKIIGAVCHGPAALLAAQDESGRWPFAGRRITALSDEEEIEFGTADNAPWLLAATLREKGANFQQGPNWGVFIVRDANLITGQNPQSSAALADAVIEALGGGFTTSSMDTELTTN